MAAALGLGFVLLLAVGVPIAFVMGGAATIALLVDHKFSLLTVPQRLFNGINSFPLMAVPFFILAADLMSASGITGALLRFADSCVGHIRGGLGHVNIMTNTLFAGISGSALADAAGPGAILMRMMKRTGYDQYYSAALSAATATIGPIIPPSIIMVVYALSDNSTTVAALFLAGVVPGVLLALALALANHIIAVRRGYRFRTERIRWSQRGKAFIAALPALLMPVLILGGILSGVFTPTEASAAAVVYALAVGFFVTRELTLERVYKVVLSSALTTSAALLIVSMASLFAWLLTILQIPQSIASAIFSLTENPAAIMTIITLFVLICGLFIDTLPAVIILVPVLAPLALQANIDPVHFAMAIILNLTIGMITPPVGAVLFVVTAVGRLDFARLSKAILPLLAAELVVLALIVYVPAISTALPSLFGYSR